MSSYDFLAPCSTPKRQRTTSERERLVNLPIEGPSRRKTPANLDLNACDFLFSGLPLDSPTTRQCSSKQQARLATNFPDFDIQALVPPSNFHESFRSDVQFGDNSLSRGVSRPLQITHADVENFDLPFSLGPLEYQLKNVQQTPSACAANLLRAEPFINRTPTYFLEEPWCNDSLSKMTCEASSYSSLASLGSSSDYNPIGDFDSSVEAFASMPSFELTQTHHENTDRRTQAELKDLSTTRLMSNDLNLIDSGTNLVDNDLKKSFNVPMLSLHVTNNFREAQNIIDIVRREAMKRQLYSKDRDIWSEEASRAFDEAIRAIPRLGRAKILALTPEGCKPFGRNELIADYIYRRTGIVRHRKQVSSHIQVIKNSKKLGTHPELLDSEKLSQNVLFDQCSASWFGGYLSKDVLILYPCTPEFPFPSRTLEHQAPAQNEKEYMAFLQEVAHARNSKPLA